jgi:hypothetical protein
LRGGGREGAGEIGVGGGEGRGCAEGYAGGGGSGFVGLFQGGLDFAEGGWHGGRGVGGGG